IIVLGLIVFAEPFDTIFRFINPVYHTLSMQILLPVGLCILAGHSAKSLEKNGVEFSVNRRPVQFLLLAMISIVLYVFAVWITNFAQELSYMRAAAVLAAILMVVGIWLYVRVRKIFNAIALGATSLLAVILVYLMTLFSIGNVTFLSHLKNISASLLLLLLTGAYIWIWNLGKHAWKRPFTIVCVPVSLLALLVTLYPWTAAIRELPGTTLDFALAMLGLVRFLIVAAIFIMILMLLSRRQLRSNLLFPIFLAIILFELLPDSKVHSHLVNN